MKTLYGVTVAMITPLTEENKVDCKAVEILTETLIQKGVHCLYPCGTTGEMFRLSVQERKKIAETVVSVAAGRVPVYIHCGCMNQEDTIELAQHAQEIGADGVGVVTPVFFSQNTIELETYYTKVADSVEGFPLYLYNIPQCAANDLTAETVRKLADNCKNIVGIKYSFPDINRTIDYIGINNGSFSVLHGCDRAFVSMLALGCKGTVSGCAGVFPEPFVAAYEAYGRGDLKKAQEIQKVCIRLGDALKRGSNMSYFKNGIKLRGLNGGYMRAPQLDLSMDEVEKLKEKLNEICSESNIDMKLT